MSRIFLAVNCQVDSARTLVLQLLVLLKGHEAESNGVRSPRRSPGTHLLALEGHGVCRPGYRPCGLMSPLMLAGRRSLGRGVIWRFARLELVRGVRNHFWMRKRFRGRKSRGCAIAMCGRRKPLVMLTSSRASIWKGPLPIGSREELSRSVQEALLAGHCDYWGGAHMETHIVI